MFLAAAGERLVPFKARRCIKPAIGSVIWTRLNVIMCDTGEPLEVDLIIPIWLSGCVRSLGGSKGESSDARLAVVFEAGTGDR